MKAPSTLAVRFGFVLLLGALLAFEVLFVRELEAGREALDLERQLRSERATELLRSELRAALDVGEARIEALETLPHLEDDGLWWVRAGVQVVPRVPRAKGQGEAAAFEALSAALEVDAGTPLVARLFRAWPQLDALQAAQACVHAQRLAPRDLELRDACARALAAERLSFDAGVEPSLQRGADGGWWMVVRRDDELRGVVVDEAAVMARVKTQLARHATLSGADDVQWVSAAPQPSLALVSARFDAEEGRLRRAFTWKTALLALTLALGAWVVWLSRLAERREAATLQLQREFISAVSHELRTPIAAIRVLAETLERKLGDAPAAKDYPRRLVAASDGLGLLVDNLLSFSRIEAGRLTPRPSRVSLAATLPALLEEDARLSLEKKVTVRCEGLEALPPVELDPELWRIVALNLLRNAWKHARPEVSAVQVTVTGAVEHGAVVLRFSDDGPGIATERWERVFEAFHQQRAQDATAGAGLGLALCRRIMRLHGGELRLVAPSTFELNFRA